MPSKWAIEWRLYYSAGLIGRLIGWRSNGPAGQYTHVDVVDPETGWLWGAHADSMTLPAREIPKGYRITPIPDKGIHIPSGFYPRPPNYQVRQWRRVTSFKLPVSQLQLQRFWEFTTQQQTVPYDARGLLDTYVFGRDWRSPGAWYCSEEQAAACEYAFILRKLIVDAVDPADFAALLNQAGADRTDLPIPVPELPETKAA